MQRYASQLGPLGEILSSVGGGWLAAAGAAGGFAYLLEQGIVQVEDYGKEMLRVQGVLRATGYASGLTSDDVHDAAQTIADSTLQTRDAALAAAAELLTFGNIGKAAFLPILKLSASVASVFNVDLLTAAKQVGKAMDDPVQGMMLLRRIIGALPPAQTELIKNFVATGETAKAQAVLIDVLTKKLGGAAESEHSGLAGAIGDVGKQWNYLLQDFAKTSGGSSAALKLIDGLAAALGDLDAEMKKSDAFRLMMNYGIGGPIGLVFSGGSAPKGSTAAPHVAESERAQAAAGPAAHTKSVIDGFVATLGDVVNTMKAKNEELKKAPRVQAIDRALDEAAAKIGIAARPLPGMTPEEATKTLTTNPIFAGKVAQIRAEAAAEYDLAQARIAGKKAAEAAKEAERKARAALSEQARGALDVFKRIDELTAKIHGTQPGADRAAAVSAETLKLAPEQAYLAPEVGAAAGAAFDAATLNEQIAKGGELAKAYRDQTESLTADKAAAEAAEYETNALAAIYQKTGAVSTEAAAAIEKQAQAILAAGHAAGQASEIYRDQVQLGDQLRDGLDRMAEAGVNGFHGLREAAQQFLQQMADLIIKLYVMGPILDATLGKQGTAGGGLLGPGLQWLTGGATSSNLGEIGQTSIPSAAGNISSPVIGDIGASGASGGIGGLFSSIAGMFAGGGEVHGHGTTKSDSVLIRASQGERVMTADANARYGDLLEAMNRGTLPAFARGGTVGRAPLAVPRMSQPRIAGTQLHASTSVNIDARGAQEGVADQIKDAAPKIVAAAVSTAIAQFDRMFPMKLHTTMRDFG
ncbi:MAG: phage tail length tape measure family protein [Rhizomicrobium sp.]